MNIAEHESSKRMHAFVLLRARYGLAASVAEAARSLQGVVNADVVLEGQYDVIVDLRSPNMAAFEKAVRWITNCPGVECAETCVSGLSNRDMMTYAYGMQG